MKYTNSYTLRIFFVCLFILFLGLVSSSNTHAENNSITVNVISTNYQFQEWGRYPLINFLGEKDVPLFANTNPIWKSHVEKHAKLLVDSRDMYFLKNGEILDLGCGYGLCVKQINTSDNNVLLELDKDGQYVDHHVVYVTNGGDNTWTCTLDKILGEDDVPVLKVHVYKLYKGEVDNVVQLDGLWLIDFANAMQIFINAQYGNFKIKAINNGVDASNLGSLILISNSPSPSADFENSTSVNEPLKVSFIDTSEGTPTSWYWDFGDGATSADQNPTHTYAEAGNYQVTLTVWNANGTTTNSHWLAVANAQYQNVTTKKIVSSPDMPIDTLTRSVKGNAPNQTTSTEHVAPTGQSQTSSTPTGSIDWGFWQVVIGIIGLVLPYYIYKLQKTPSQTHDKTQQHDNLIDKKGSQESQKKNTVNSSADVTVIPSLEEWNMRPIEFETHLTSEEIRAYGGSQRYGTGGRWFDENDYISIGGYKSKGGMPFKLKTANEIIPISPTDVKELTGINAIRAYKDDEQRI